MGLSPRLLAQSHACMHVRAGGRSCVPACVFNLPLHSRFNRPARSKVVSARVPVRLLLVMQAPLQAPASAIYATHANTCSLHQPPHACFCTPCTHTRSLHLTHAQVLAARLEALRQHHWAPSPWVLLPPSALKHTRAHKHELFPCAAHPGAPPHSRPWMASPCQAAAASAACSPLETRPLPPPCRCRTFW